MRIRHTNSDYIHGDGRRENLSRLLDDGDSRVVRDREWRPLTDGQRENLGRRATEGAEECRLVCAGDVYFASIWEVR